MIAVAIDGPSGAGKSTVARACARELGFVYVDTGALYRAVGLFAVRKGVDTKSAAALEKLLSEIAVELRFVDGEQRVLLCGEDVSQAIRAPEMAMAASDVSALPAVRGFLFALQLDIAARNNVIMDGRDIGTVVLPDAQVKIFLTASAQARARRRCAEHEGRGECIAYERILEEIEQRDHNDTSRDIAPLKQAADAVLIDTSGLDFAQSVQAVLQVIREKTVGGEVVK